MTKVTYQKTGRGRKDLTEEKLNNLYKFIKDYTLQNGFPPSVREMCSGLNINSTATAFYYINKLVDLGYLRKSGNFSRGIEVIDKYSKYKKDTVQIPLIGKVTAGQPILAQESLEDVYALPVDLFASGELFMLNVRGDSMINAGIMDGDMIVVRSQNVCENGQIAVVMIDEEATVKRFYKEKSHFRLQPENDSMKPILADNVDILGIVVGLIRRL